MSREDDGGQAFPIPEGESYGHTYGMSLRDYFAAKALPSIYADCVAEMNKSGFPDENWREGVAKDVWMMADAMLKARNA